MLAQPLDRRRIEAYRVRIRIDQAIGAPCPELIEVDDRAPLRQP
jgi:hypothetical protein